MIDPGWWRYRRLVTVRLFEINFISKHFRLQWRCLWDISEILSAYRTVSNNRAITQCTHKWGVKLFVCISDGSNRHSSSAVMWWIKYIDNDLSLLLWKMLKINSFFFDEKFSFRILLSKGITALNFLVSPYLSDCKKKL